MQQIRFDDIPALEATISEEFGPWVGDHPSAIGQGLIAIATPRASAKVRGRPLTRPSWR